MASTEELKKDSTNIVRLKRVRDDLDPDDVVEDATISCTLYDMAGVVVTGASNLPMTFVEADTGPEYRVVLSHTLPLQLNAVYDLVSTIVATDGSRLVKHQACRCVKG